MLAEQRSDVDADQDHQQARRTKQHGQYLANHGKQSPLKMRGIVKVQIPAVVLIVMLREGERPGKSVDLSLGS